MDDIDIDADTIDSDAEAAERTEAPRERTELRRTGSVADSIRYRRRAQAAEAEALGLRADLESLQNESEQTLSRIAELENRLQLERQFARAGAIDVDAVCLLAQESLKSDSDLAIPELIEDLRRRRPHLFDSNAVSDLSAGTADAFPAGTTVMAPSAGREPTLARKVRNAASQARRSGDGGDLMQYMRARRSAARGAGRIRP